MTSWNEAKDYIDRFERVCAKSGRRLMTKEDYTDLQEMRDHLLVALMNTPPQLKSDPLQLSLPLEDIER